MLAYVCACLCADEEDGERRQETNDRFCSLYIDPIHPPADSPPTNTNDLSLFSSYLPHRPTKPHQVIEAAAREPLEPTHEKDMEVPSALMGQEQVGRDMCVWLVDSTMSSLSLA